MMTQPATSSRKGGTVESRAARGGMVSGINFVVNLGLNLIQVPLLLRFWPQETYGLWLSVGALALLLTSLDGGHQAYVGNLLNRYYVEDRAVFRRTLASAVRIATLTSTTQIILTLLLCVSGLASGWLGIGDQHAVDFCLAVAIYTIGWISTGSIGAILARIFAPTGLFVRSMWWAIGMRLAQFAAVTLAAWLGWGLVKTTVLFAATVFAMNLVFFADVRRLYPEFFPWWRGGDFKLGLRNFLQSCVLSLVSILDLFSLQGVVLLVTGTLGAAAVPLFTTLRTMANIAMQGTGFLLNPIQPDLVRYHVNREGGKIAAVFGFFWFATGATVNGGMVAGLFFVEPVYHFWTRGKLEFDRVLFSWLAATVLVRTLAAPIQSYLTGINHLRALSVASVTRAILTIGGVLAFTPLWGMAGIGLALFVTEFIGTLLLPWWFASRSLLELGGEVEGWAIALAVSSSLLTVIALAGFALNSAGWPWLAGCSLPAVIAISAVQWARLPAPVRARALSVLAPFSGWLGNRA